MSNRMLNLQTTARVLRARNDGFSARLLKRAVAPRGRQRDGSVSRPFFLPLEA